MALRIRESEGVNIVDIEGDIDINSSDIVETVGWLMTCGKLNILLNFENVNMVDYNGLSILAIAYKNCLNHAGRMKFMRIPLPVMELFKIVKLDAVFENYQDEEAAINSFFETEVSRMRLRRKFQRLDIHLRVRYNIISDQRKAKVFEGDVFNISAAGIFIYTPYILPLNSMVDLEFVLPDSRTFRAAGRVIWHTDRELQPHSYPGMGVSFAHLTAEQEQAIIDFIERNVTHRAEPEKEE